MVSNATSLESLRNERYGHIPAHLRAFISPVDVSDYTDVDHDTWQRMMAILMPHWERFADSDFLSGLAKTGINADRIPYIVDIDTHLQAFGWRAVPVSGFIPPAAFMEYHALGILPIARAIRKPENLEYTPAPDIVHEAAGHAPLLATPLYASLAKRFGQLAMKAGFSEHDQHVYEAIRHLSDIKECRHTAPEDIERAEKRLELVLAETPANENSPGARLSKLFWWTIEYGLIGKVDDYKLYGAGLISSPGESKSCLDASVAKLPLTLECIDVQYDITRPQPQLFVTPSLQAVSDLLDEFEKRVLV